MILLIISFFAGILTVLAPCILPVLPVIIGGSLANVKDKYRPYIIAISLAVSLMLFTILLKATSLLVNVPPQTWTYISGGIIILLGIVSLFPDLYDTLIIKLNLQAKSQRMLGESDRRSGLIGAILTGAALGPVFSSCSPTYAFVLATILPKNFGVGLIYLTSYSLGLVIMLLVISIFGKRFIRRYSWAVNPKSVFRRSLGVLFILIGIGVAAGWMQNVETWSADHLPFDVTKIDQKLISTQSTKPKYEQVTNSGLFNVKAYPEPQLSGLTNWINSQPLTLKRLRGKVVLVDFWTYSCINCVRTLPYLEKWYQTYAADGLVILGIETPEFAFEHIPSNVEQAVKLHGLTYPVASDNNLDTWNAFQNQYWPADYLIDKNGYVRRTTFGEGDYANTEKAIQELLAVKQPLTTNVNSPSGSANITPETYFDLEREADYAGSLNLVEGEASYSVSNNLPTNGWSIGGEWTEAEDGIVSNSATSTLKFNVYAKDVYVVVSLPDSKTYSIKVSSDQSGQWQGSDDPGGVITANQSTLYNIAAFPSVQSATLTLTVPSGVELHTFTFGG